MKPQKLFSLIRNKSSWIVVTIFLQTALVLNGFGQSAKNFARNTFYADATANGLSYSINYDRVFSNGKKLAISYRAGFSVLENTIALPLGIQFFTGKSESHAEFSLTLTPYIEKYQDLFSGNNKSDKKLYIQPMAGYRYQRPGGGFFGKLLVGPIIYLDPPSDDFWKMDSKVYACLTAGAGFSF